VLSLARENAFEIIKLQVDKTTYQFFVKISAHLIVIFIGLIGD
jgi:hypothetical protein